MSWLSLHPAHRRAALSRLCLTLGLVGTIAAALPHGRADAAFSSCRSDPVLVVNGTVVDVVSTLQTDASAVRELDYVVTVPAGSLIGPTRLTVGLGFPEKVTYVFSPAQPWGTMSVAATVQTQSGVAPFPTTVQVTPLLFLLSGTFSGSGLSNSTVMVNVARQLML